MFGEVMKASITEALRQEFEHINTRGFTHEFAITERLSFIALLLIHILEQQPRESEVKE